MIVLNRHTLTGKYPALAGLLRESCKRFSIIFDIETVPSAGDFNANNNRKPVFLLDALMTHRQPVVWLDADCEIKKYPSLFDSFGGDFASYNWCADPQNTNGLPFNTNLLRCSGGVLWFNYSAPAFELLVRWRDALAVHPEETDDDMLSEVFNSNRVPAQTLWLPKSYNRHTFWQDVEPVINHDFVNRAHGIA